MDDKFHLDIPAKEAKGQENDSYSSVLIPQRSEFRVALTGNDGMATAAVGG